MEIIFQALIDDGSDCLVTDFRGSSVFTHLAKGGHIWCLNFMYNMIWYAKFRLYVFLLICFHQVSFLSNCCSNLHGPQITLECMSAVDAEGHNPLDWAAETGNINVMEFFIRRGLNPYKLDVVNRGCLHWAVKNNHVDAARFLVLCGCDARQKDSYNVSPLSMAITMRDKALIRVLSMRSRIPKSITEVDYGIIQHTDPSNNSNIMYVRRSDQMNSLAIYRKNPHSLGDVLGYALIFFILWLFPVFFPFYAVIAAYVVLYFVYRRWQGKPSPNPNSCRVLKEFYASKDKGLGFWLACIIVYGVYLVSTYYFWRSEGRDPADKELSGFRHVDPYDIFHINAVSGAMASPSLLWVALLAYFTAILSWLKLVWIDWDPGIVDNRIQDFEEILAHSFIASGEPARRLFCKSTMVKKPIRGKYCVHTGAVIARMDHYCIWLNMTIGFKNHRMFFFFLLAHFVTTASASALTIRGLHWDLQKQGACDTVAHLLSRRYFFVTLLCVMSVVATFALGALIYDQFLNIITNWVWIVLTELLCHNSPIFFASDVMTDNQRAHQHDAVLLDPTKSRPHLLHKVSFAYNNQNTMSFAFAYFFFVTTGSIEERGQICWSF